MPVNYEKEKKPTVMFIGDSKVFISLSIVNLSDVLVLKYSACLQQGLMKRERNLKKKRKRPGQRSRKRLCDIQNGACLH